MIFSISQDLMYNMTRNPDNEMYFGYIDGTSNLTTTLKAPGFVSKGHYYQISSEVTESIPKIVNTQNEVIIPN